MQAVALKAVDLYLATKQRRPVIDRVLDSELARYAEAIERLGQ